MVQTVGDIFDYIEVRSISSYWNVLQNSFDKALKSENRSEEDLKENIQFLLHFLGQSIEYHGGKKVYEVSKIINLLIRVIECDFHVDVMMTLSKIGAVLLLTRNFSLDQLDASRLSKKILHIDHVEVFESFVTNSIDCSQFEILVMPDFLKYFERNLNGSTLGILAKIVQKRSSRTLLNVEKFDDFNINLKSKKSVEEIEKRVVGFKLYSSPEHFEDFINSIHILPHLISFDKDKVEKHLKTLMNEVLGDLKSKGSIKLLYILALVISTLHEINETTDDLQNVKIIEEIVSLTTKFEINFLSLKILNFLVETLQKAKRNFKLFERIHTTMKENLMSPHQQIRLLTLQILSQFDHLKIAKMLDSDDESLFTILRKIEEITPTIQTCRDQVLLLQKIEYDSTYFQLIRDTPYILDAMKFCLGFLNTKFQLLFEPTKAVLESYIEGFDLDVYWNLYKEQLNSSIEQKIESSETDNKVTSNDFINANFLEFCIMKDKAYDPIMYRVRLWQVLSETKTTIHDRKQKDIVEMFIQFLRIEFECEDDDDEAPKARQKLLISHLQVLKNFNNPKCVSRTNELRKIYFNFLIHRNFYVQKMALDCILQYKDEALVNYKETLHNILDEKTFRTEITKFNLNADIKEFHRDEFVKILLPILYSKLTIKSTKKDQDGFRNRKEVIIRFMTNLKENEIDYLMNTVLGKISSVLTINDTNEVNVRPNELQSMHEFLDMVMKNVAGLFSLEFQRKILQHILAISCFCVSTETSIYKSLKQNCLGSLVYFFERFDEFDWRVENVDLIFELFIWKHLESFHQNSSQNVSGLMKLFVEWSKNPKYYEFLQKTDSSGNFITKSIILLLSNKSASTEVVDCVLDIIERLLTLKSDDEIIVKDINFGTKLIQPFINDILLKLRETLNNKKQRTLNQRNLLILSRVTELVTDIDSSKLLLDILFPLTLKKTMEKTQDDEGIMKLLSTLLNLLKVVENPSSYIRQLAPIFEHVHEVNQRKLLLKVFNQTVSDDDSMKLLINDLNAYDRRWIEQPDYEKRLSVFHQIEKIMNDGEISVDLAVIFIYHCFYFLKHDNDMAVRDNSGHFLKLVCCKVIKQAEGDKQLLDYFLAKTVMNLIQKRIRDVEKVRYEVLNLLGTLARDHPNAHPVLADLHPLTNSSNRDLDFFDNITHLQKFRHMKALRKFVEIAPKYKKIPSVQTLVEFLLPISRTFICAAEYKRKSKVVEAAIEFVAAISKFLPWIFYERLLISYVRRMKADVGYQKQLVKLIPAIMDSFHFELNDAEKQDENVRIEEDDNVDEVEENSNDEDDADVQTTTVMVHGNLSNRVLRSLTRRLVPSLAKIISDISTETHKLNKQERKVKEKASMVKIPIALSIIKLLKKLPKKHLDDNLSQIVLKVAAFLKSSLKQVRAIARHTIKEIVAIVGPSYLGQVIGNLKSVLTRGFQVHVLSVTVFTLMEAMKQQLMKSEDSNKILNLVVKICIDDIFGRNVEENDFIGSIPQKAPEVKPSRKSFDTLGILAATITENYVFELLTPLKNLLHDTQSKKTVIKIQDCLLKIVNGLTSNPKMSDESLMILTHGTISESIPDLLPQQKKKETKSKVIINDCFIIAQEPKRRGASVANKAVKQSKQTNSYVLVEFGFEMLHLVLKRKKFPDESYLNPLVPMLCDSLKSNFLKVNMLAVKCLTIMWHHRLEMSNLRDNVNAIVAEVFAIIHKYATNQISKKDIHFLLVKNCFKCVIAVMRQADYFTVNENQLKALLLYVEQDLQSMDKDNMAFVLLRSILDKKLMMPELHEIMKKVSNIAITSEIDEKRATIRPIVLTYLMDYPLGKKLDSLVKFFIAQLNYEEISGRESAVLMLTLIIKSFPIVSRYFSLHHFSYDNFNFLQAMLRKFSGLFFLSFGTRLLNDDSPSCKEKIADAIELLIKQLDNNPTEQLFEIVSSLLKDEKRVHREMGAQLSIRFMNAEGDNFEKRIATILPLLIQSIKMQKTNEEDDGTPGKFVRVKRVKLDEIDEGFNEGEERDQQVAEDHHLIQTLNAIIRILELNENVLKNDELKTTIDNIGYTAQELLGYEHVWVRLKCLRIVNFMIKSLDLEIIEKLLLDQEVTAPREFLYSKKEFRSLAFDMAVQMKSDTDEELLDIIMENLFEITKLLKNLPFEGMINDKKDFSLMWIMRRLRYAVHSEVATAPQTYLIRKRVFNFFDALIDVLDLRVLKRLASPMLTTLLREVVDGEHVIEELKQVANSTANKIKTQIGLQDFDKIRLDVQSRMLRKRVDRRKNLAQEKINDPAKAASRTINKQLKKQDTKKRKRLMLQDGMVLPKKRKFTSKHY